MNNGRDCEHGRQVGKCDSCDLIRAENTIARLLAGKWNGDEFKAISSTKVIAEIKAEAGRAGFIEGVRQMCDNEIGMLGHDAESCANHYAARVRLGFEPGTWLKDSNVNGGKRQGGE